MIVENYNAYKGHLYPNTSWYKENSDYHAIGTMVWDLVDPAYGWHKSLDGDDLQFILMHVKDIPIYFRATHDSAYLKRGERKEINELVNKFICYVSNVDNEIGTGALIGRFLRLITVKCSNYDLSHYWDCINKALDCADN